MDPTPWAKIGSAIKDFPLWLLVAVALSISVVLAVPAFREWASPKTPVPLILCALVAWIFVFARATEPLTKIALVYLDYRSQSHYYHVTVLEHECVWAISRQTDGTDITQFEVHLLVKNRSTERLRIVHARVLKPQISGGALTELVATQSAFSPQFSSTNIISPGQAARVHCTLLYKGVPPRASDPFIKSRIEVVDDSGQRERVNLTLKRVPS